MNVRELPEAVAYYDKECYIQSILVTCEEVAVVTEVMVNCNARPLKCTQKAEEGKKLSGCGSFIFMVL